MPHSHKYMLRTFAQMTEAQLSAYIASQDEIDRRCKNPSKANKTLHDLYTRWAKQELARRPAAPVPALQESAPQERQRPA